MKTSASIAMLVLVFGLIAIVPIFTIWSMNHLFNMGWVVDVPTWFSVFWIQAIVSGGLINSAKSKKK